MSEKKLGMKKFESKKNLRPCEVSGFIYKFLQTLNHNIN